MNRQKTAYPLLTVMLLCTSVTNAQDVAYSQFYANPLYLNPALAGIKTCPNLTLNYRNQWPSVGKGYVNYSASYDHYFDEISGAAGLMVNAADAGGGLLKSVSASIIYAYHLVLSGQLVANVGFQGSYLQNKLNWNDLIFVDQLDINNGIANPTINESQPDQLSKGFSDFSTGILLGYKEKYYLGAAAHHLTQPNMAFYDNMPSRLDMKITVHAGAYIDLERNGRGNAIEDMSFSPNIMYLQQGKFHQLNTGMYLNVYPFITGMWFRHNFENPDAVIALIGFEQGNFNAGYSYDFSLSRLTSNNGGAHEVSFSWHFACSKKVSKANAIKCPRF